MCTLYPIRNCNIRHYNVIDLMLIFGMRFVLTASYLVWWWLLMGHLYLFLGLLDVEFNSVGGSSKMTAVGFCFISSNSPYIARHLPTAPSTLTTSPITLFRPATVPLHVTPIVLQTAQWSDISCAITPFSLDDFVIKYITDAILNMNGKMRNRLFSDNLGCRFSLTYDALS